MKHTTVRNRWSFCAISLLLDASTSRAGIFREHIKYLLVLTTALDVVLLGVSFADDGRFPTEAGSIFRVKEAFE